MSDLGYRVSQSNKTSSASCSELGPGPATAQSPLITTVNQLDRYLPPQNPTEDSLLRDLIFTLQGISTTSFPFKDDSTIVFPTSLSAPVISLLTDLAEPALLYKELSIYTNETSSTLALVTQAFKSAIRDELTSYLVIVNALDEHIREPPPKSSNQLSPITLKLCLLRLQGTIIQLRLCSAMVSKVKASTSPAQQLSNIHALTFHGDPTVSDFAHNLLIKICKPFFEILRNWIVRGELIDHYGEFFIQNNDMGSLWDNRFSVIDALIPSFLDPQIADMIFQTGRSVNFINEACGKPEWSNNGLLQPQFQSSFIYGHDQELKKCITAAYKSTVEQLNGILFNEYKLWTHLTALKNYLFLGSGDFIAVLVEALSPLLDRPANSLYRYNLTAALETAVRGSNAQYEDAASLNCLDARMLEMSHGDIGWEVFTLEYKVESPLDVIVTPWSSRQYLKIFNFLWYFKRVEFVLEIAWKESITGHRGILSKLNKRLSHDWRLVRSVLSQMLHFITELQYYMAYEVIESSWTKLQEDLARPSVGLDTIIAAHRSYLMRITNRGLLGTERGSNRTPEQAILAQLHTLLDLMLDFGNCIGLLQQCSVQEYLERESKQVMAGETTRRRTTKVQDYEYEIEGDIQTQNLTTEVESRIAHLSNAFQHKVEILLTDLAHQKDWEMRFLGSRLNYNHWYKIHHHHRRKTAATQNTRDQDSPASSSSTTTTTAGSHESKTQMATTTIS